MAWNVEFMEKQTAAVCVPLSITYSQSSGGKYKLIGVFFGENADSGCFPTPTHAHTQSSGER